VIPLGKPLVAAVVRNQAMIRVLAHVVVDPTLPTISINNRVRNMEHPDKVKARDKD
jgi:hypothetical protein